jgi:23S rRNA pseudouridine2457 synthase
VEKIHQHYIIHKPFGFISQFVYTHKRKKKLLGELYDFAEGTMAIGRLDVNSEGLLLLTTNGKMSHYVRSSKVEKEYYVQLDGIIDELALVKLREGVLIGFDGGKYLTLPAKVESIEIPDFKERVPKVRDDRHGPTSWVSITIKEGKFRQVRKMTSAVGFPTLRLVRVRIGKIKLDHLELGGVIPCSELDV